MNNIIQFPLPKVRDTIKRKIWLVQRYNEACILFDRYREDYLIHNRKGSKQMADNYLRLMDAFGREVDAVGGAA